jgi:uncharacterized membrane protein
MGKVVYAVLVGLVGAAIVHLAILFLIPHYAPRDAWSQLATAGEAYQLTPVSGSGPGVVPLVQGGDPLFRAAACRFDLADGPLRLSSVRTVPFWTLSIHDRRGQTTYSLSDRAATDALLDVVILSPLHMAEMRRAMPAEVEQSILIESATSQGVVVVRAFVPDESWASVADRFFSDLICEPI